MDKLVNIVLTHSSKMTTTPCLRSIHADARIALREEKVQPLQHPILNFSRIILVLESQTLANDTTDWLCHTLTDHPFEQTKKKPT